HYQNKKTILIANKSWADLARQLCLWDEVVSVNVAEFRKNFRYRWTIFKEMRGLGIETAVHPVHMCHLTTGDTVIRISNANTRIGSKGDITSKMKGWQKWLANGWYNQLIPSSNENTNIFDKNDEFTKYLTRSQEKENFFYLPKLKVNVDNLAPTQKYFLIFPGSNGTYKMWPKERFASLAQSIYSKTKYIPVVCGSHLENELCRSIVNSVEGAINLAGKTSISQVVELIRKAEFVVGNDSASVHIAAATNTISFCILGGGHYGIFMPYPKNRFTHTPIVLNFKMPCYGCGWRCEFALSEKHAFPCVASVSEEKVMNAIMEYLDNVPTNTESVPQAL
ncbi:MAG: glycosyltransferase family 9 protein, partial [Flammeovirgaceae bacterium]